MLPDVAGYAFLLGFQTFLVFELVKMPRHFQCPRKKEQLRFSKLSFDLIRLLLLLAFFSFT